MEEYVVTIKSHEDNAYNREFDPITSLRMAQKVENGLNINLNHDKFYTMIKVFKEGKLIKELEREYRNL